MISAAQSQLIDASLAPGQLQTQISTSVLKKTQDVAKQEGAALLDLINSAADAGQRGGDPLVAKATGLGGMLDLYA